MNTVQPTTTGPANGPMEYGDNQAETVSYLYDRVLNDVKNMQASGNTSYVPNSQFAHDLDNAVAEGTQLTQGYYRTGNEINSNAYQFLNSATSQLSELQDQASNGDQVLTPISTLAANVVEALSPLVASPAAKSSGGASTSPTSSSSSSSSGSQAFGVASKDLSAEKSATSTSLKASDVSNAISNLIAGINGEAPPSATTSPAPVASATLPKSVATDALTSLDQLSQYAADVGAPGSVQDSIANVVGSIEGMFAGNTNATSISGYIRIPTAGAVTSDPSSSAAPTLSQEATSLLQGFQGIITQLKPYLANTSTAGNQAIDSVAKVVSEIEALSSKGGVAAAA